MSLKNFRRGETTYICQSCKKRTRNVGGDEAQCRLCLDCFELAGIDNHLTDNGAESMVEYYGDEARRYFKKRPELIPLFPEIAAALGLK